MLKNKLGDLEKDSFDPLTIEEEINKIIKDIKRNPIKKMTEKEIREHNEKVFGK